MLLGLKNQKSCHFEGLRRHVGGLRNLALAYIIISMAKNYFVYILTNYKNSVFYTGFTNDLNKRVLEHKTKINPDSFTSKYKLYKLVWYELFTNPEEAIIVEKKVKDMRREKKINLIKSKNPSFEDLYTLR